jgi:DNA-binding LacI/PurR family transcriptional regulator
VIEDDNYNGTCAIMKHLISEKGHRKIAHITERLEHPSYQIRYKAFKDMLALYEIPDLYECVSAHDTSFESGIEAMNHLLSYDTPPTAVFATTDTLALGAMHAAKRAGLRIPEDIAIAGYDDIEAASMSYPPLTTVRVDREYIGKTAVDALMKQIANPNEPTHRIVIKNKLVVRAST